MQPNNQPQDWQQPSEQPSQAPYIAIPTEQSTASQPVVTLQPDAPRAQYQAQPVSQPMPQSQPQVQAPQQPVIEDDPSLAPNAQQPVRWRATEYIQREKSTVWFVIFGVVVLALMALSIFVMKSISFTILIPVMAVSLIVYSYRPPRTLEYTLSRQGLHIDDRLYPFSEFKSFGVVKSDDEYSVMLVPTKRFKPGVSVYFPEEAGEAIVDMLGARIPMQELSLDLVDRLIRKLRI